MFRPRPTSAALVALVALAAPSPAVAALGDRSPDAVWRELRSDAVAQSALMETFGAPDVYRVVQLDDLALFRILRSAPLEYSEAARSSPTILTLPLPDGGYGRFGIAESPILAADLAAARPDIRTYVAQGLDDPTHTARLDRTPLGFHALIVTPDDILVVARATSGPGDLYVSFRQSDLEGPDQRSCLTDGESAQEILAAPEAIPPSGATLHTYRLAIAGTGEFTSFYGSEANALAGVTSTVNQLNAIYERELSVRLLLTCTRFFTDAATDPFPTPNITNPTLLIQADNALDAACGTSNYDIGHLFHWFGGGIFDGWSGRAVIGSLCSGVKGRAATATGNPSGTVFVAEALTHEMGHQFGAQHIYNSTAGGCVERVIGSAYEIGAGTTIMSYACAGCINEDPPGCADPYYNSHNIDQITNLRDGLGCSVRTATGNAPPLVDAGPDYTIPRQTPFTLTATGSDPDGDPLTWCWEQHDLGLQSPPLNGGATGPLFRSYPPVPSPARTFPNSTELLNGPANPSFEILPTANRILTFRATARDNRAGGGGVNYDTVVLTVQGEPFRVLVPNGGEGYGEGCSLEVRWTVGGGSVAASVNILLSTDGGRTFPVTLAANVPNDGAQEVTLPCMGALTSRNGRIRIEAVGNIFFDISDANFNIADGSPTSAIVTLNRTSLWPPNHRLVEVTATVEPHSSCGPTNTVLLWVRSDEPENGTGDGDLAPDIVGADVGTADFSFQLRSERAGDGDGRTYSIAYLTTDVCGNGTGTEVQVRVGHDQSGQAFVTQVGHPGTTDYLAVVVPGSTVLTNGDELGVPVNRSASGAGRSQPVNTLTVGNTAGVASPTQVVWADVDGDRVSDAIALFELSKAQEVRSASDELDGPVGLHYQNTYGEGFLVEDLLDAPRNDASSPIGAAVIAALGEIDGGVESRTPAAEAAPQPVDDAAPAVTRLAGIRPNPFMREASMAFELAHPGAVRLEVYALSGARVRGLAARRFDAGRHAVTWDGRDDAGRRLPPGMYFVRFVADGVTQTGKAMLLP